MFLPERAGAATLSKKKKKGDGRMKREEMEKEIMGWIREVADGEGALHGDGFDG